MASVANGRTAFPPGKKKETIYFFYWLFKFAGESCREALLPFFSQARGNTRAPA